MSDHPFLTQAARSLRDRTAARAGAGEETLARVVSVIRRRTRRRRLLAVVGLQLAIGATGVGAWAAASGRLQSLLAPFRPAARPEPAKPPRPLPRRTAAPPTPLAPPTPPPRRVAAVTPPRAPVQASPTVPAGEDELYRAAHEAHFVRREYQAAVAAWDRYLALHRPGRLVLEARYNRAIALFRLGRRDEAALALRPFAAGEYGPYRQEEARALLRRLAQAPP